MVRRPPAQTADIVRVIRAGKRDTAFVSQSLEGLVGRDIYVYSDIYIYIYRERERERDRFR